MKVKLYFFLVLFIFLRNIFGNHLNRIDIVTDPSLKSPTNLLTLRDIVESFQAIASDDLLTNISGNYFLLQKNISGIVLLGLLKKNLSNFSLYETVIGGQNSYGLLSLYCKDNACSWVVVPNDKVRGTGIHLAEGKVFTVTTNEIKEFKQISYIDFLSPYPMPAAPSLIFRKRLLEKLEVRETQMFGVYSVSIMSNLTKGVTNSYSSIGYEKI